MTVVGLCERFRCLPSQLYAEDAQLFQMVRMVDREREVNPPDAQ